MAEPITPAKAPNSLPTIKQQLARNGNRGPGFDTLRLVAAIAVMLHHAFGLEYDLVADDFLHHWSKGYTHLGLFAVSIFFCISGFLVTPGLVRNGDIIGYFSRRFMRIMPLLAVVVIITAFVLGPMLTNLALADYFSSGTTWLYLKNITTSLSLELPGVVPYDGTGNVNNPLWTLRFEWLCYIAIALAMMLGLLKRRWLFLALWLVAMVAGPGLGYALPGGPILLLFSYFGAGALIYLFADIIRWNRWLLAIAIAVLIAALRTQAAPLLSPPLTALIVVGLGLIRFPWSNPLAKVDLSYGVYLTHAVVLVVLMEVHPFTSWIALFVACLICTLCVALATWTFIERPALNHKNWPEQLARMLLAKIHPRFAALQKL